jgi:ABC-type sugar transport system ATPase subunit
MSENIIEFVNVSKRFGGVVALSGVSFSVRKGEVHALVGENGAGKSTLINLCGGVHARDEGKIVFKGEDIQKVSTQHSKELGISIVYQEFPLCMALTVAENIFLSPHPKAHLGVVDRKSMDDRARQLFGNLGVDIDPAATVAKLSVGEQQMVEISKALSLDADLIIMDEPTSALTQRETDHLFGVIRRLKERGITVIYVSHRLREVFAISDRITVLRDGRYVGTVDTPKTTMDEVVQMMVGRQISSLFPKEQAEVHEVVLKGDHLARAGAFQDVSFEVRKGEVVGLAGLQGSGNQELLRTIFGINRLDAGALYVNQAPLTISSPDQAIKLGIAYVPADRRLEGTVLSLSVAENVGLLNLNRVSALGYVVRKKLSEIVTRGIKRLNIKTPSQRQIVQNLSGGNQQKVVLAKWLSVDPKVLLLDDPTRGIDVGSKAEIHHLLNQLTREGHAVMLISSELPELLAMSDRLLVMYRGRIVDELPRAEATEERVMALMTGAATA